MFNDKMFTFAPETDFYRINQAFHSANNFKWANNGEEFSLFPSENENYFSCSRDGEFLGLIMLRDLDGNNAEIHIAFLPEAYGKVRGIGKEFLYCMSAVIPGTVLWAPVKKENSLARSLVENLGFEYQGDDGNGYNLYCRSI